MATAAMKTANTYFQVNRHNVFSIDLAIHEIQSKILSNYSITPILISVRVCQWWGTCGGASSEDYTFFFILLLCTLSRVLTLNTPPLSRGSARYRRVYVVHLVDPKHLFKIPNNCAVLDP